MAVKFANSVRNAMMAAYEATIGTSPKLRIYTGAAPAGVGSAATGDLLVEMDLPSDWMGAPSDGAVAKLGTWSADAIETGVAGYYRITNTAGTTVFEQGTVTMSAGGDLILNNTNIAVGQTVVISSFNKTAPGA